MRSRVLDGPLKPCLRKGEGRSSGLSLLSVRMCLSVIAKSLLCDLSTVSLLAYRGPGEPLLGTA